MSKQNNLHTNRKALSERRWLVLARPLIIIVALIVTWQMLVIVTDAPKYMLPTPADVWTTLIARHDVLFDHAQYTIAETVIGLFAGAALGTLAAIPMALFSPVRFWLMPILLVSQAIPFFALASGVVAGLWSGVQNRHGRIDHLLPGYRRLL